MIGTFLLALALQAPAEEPLKLDDSVEAAATKEAKDSDEAPDASDADEAATAPVEPVEAATADGAVPVAAETPDNVQAIVAALENGFRTCAIQVVSRDHVSRTRADALKAQGILVGEVPPLDVADIAKAQLPGDPVFARVAGDAGTVWLVASATAPVCKVVLSNTAAAPAARAAVATRLDANQSWTADTAKSKSADGVTRKVWTQKAGETGQVLFQMDGPDQPDNNGEGIQAILTLALVTPKAD